MAVTPKVSDEMLVEAVAALGGAQRVSRKGLWSEVAQRVGLKATKAADCQKRYDFLLNEMDESSSEDPESADDDPGPAGEDEDDDSDDRQHEVHSIIGEKVKKGKKIYLVKWDGRDDNESTWEPEANLNKCEDKVTKWQKKRKKDGDARNGAAHRDDNDGQEERPKKRHAKSTAGTAAHPLEGLLGDDDSIATVLGFHDKNLETMLVKWASGNYSIVRRDALAREEPAKLIAWYHKRLVVEE